VTSVVLTWLAWASGAYLVGSVPFGFLIGKAHGVDIRERGSGNVGATNLGRVLGKKWGLTCFALDVCKGLGPTLAYGLTMTPAEGGGVSAWLAALLWLGVGIAAIVGHMASVFLGFKGGKGVATGFGVVLGVWPVLTLPAIAVLLTWIVVTWVSGYVSLGSVAAACGLPVATAVSCVAWGVPAGAAAVLIGLTAALAGLITWKHRGNLARLRAGTESVAGWTRKGRTTNPADGSAV